jgi:DNA-binding MarR family transcriptional regulator
MSSSQARDSAAQAASTPAQADGQAGLLKLEDFLPHRLNVLSSLVSQALTRVYGRRGIGIPEWRVLVTLGENGVLTGKAVGAQTHMHKTKVSRAVAQLEQRKFVAKRANRADLRESFLSLTPAGRPERARIHGAALRGGRACRPSRLRPRHEAIDQALGRAGRRDRRRQDLSISTIGWPRRSPGASSRKEHT